MARGPTRPRSLTQPRLAPPVPGNRRVAGGALPTVTAASCWPATAGTGADIASASASPHPGFAEGGGRPPFLLRAQRGGAAAIFSEGRGGAGRGGAAGREMEAGNTPASRPAARRLREEELGKSPGDGSPRVCARLSGCSEGAAGGCGPREVEGVRA